MKRIVTTITVLLVTTYDLAAQRDYNTLSVDAGIGISLPLFPTDGIEVSDYLFSKHFDFGVQYMVSENLGLRLHYAYDGFDGPSKYTFNNYHRIGIEGVFNLSRKLRINYNEYFNLLLHAGGGVTFAYPGAIKRFRDTGEFSFGLKPENTLNYERIGNLMIGITPQYRLSSRWALKLDINFTYNFEQQYFYNGELIDVFRTKVRGGFINLSLGVKFYLGFEYEHADWLIAESVPAIEIDTEVPTLNALRATN